ncbi:MAG: cell division protein FtsL [Acidimicrobiia bacterium]
MGLIVFVGLLAIVVFQVVIAQRGLALDSIRSRIDEEQTRYERLRLEAAALSSPERIESEATERLGMVRPDFVNYLEAPIGGTDTGTVGGTTSTLADPEEWDAVKPHLDAQP